MTPAGLPWVRLGIRVDSLVPGRGYAFLSNGVLTDSDGFQIDVYRDVASSVPIGRDTATVELKLRRGAAPIPNDPGETVARIRLQFGLYGTRYPVSYADYLVISIP